MNLMKCEKNANADTTSETKKNETYIGCNITGRGSRKGIPHKMSVDTPWKKSCPKCRGDMFYGNKKRLNRAMRQNKICRSCAVKIRQPRVSVGEKYERECPTCKRVLKYKSYTSFWNQYIKNSSCVSCNRIGKKSTLGYKFSDTSKRKMREAALKRVDKIGGGPNANPNACTYMDNLKPEYNFQHAMNGGEFRVCGYSVDGYDKEKNVVFEYDEPQHYSNGNLKEHDVKRMEEIKGELRCKFLRYDERNKILTLS